MSSPRSHRARRAPAAPVFAALGDQTRLALLARLAQTPRLSIARLTEGSALTRQAITKHLRVLRSAGLVRSVRHGRESRFELDGAALQDAQRTLGEIARQWGDALTRLKAFVEGDQGGSDAPGSPRGMPRR